MSPNEFKARLEASGADKRDIAHIAGVSLRAVRMVTSLTGWHGKPVNLSESSPIRKALEAAEKGKRAPNGVTYKGLESIYRRRKW